MTAAGTANLDGKGGFGKWSDVEQAFDFWAERLRGRLASLSGS